MDVTVYCPEKLYFSFWERRKIKKAKKRWVKAYGYTLMHIHQKELHQNLIITLVNFRRSMFRNAA